jgi:hypothetical protein
LSLHLLPTPADGDEFDMYAVRLDLDSWSYAVDDSGLIYGPGWYPFHRPLTRNEWHPAAGINTRRVPTGEIGLVPVRLAPSCAFMAWRNEYVTVEPPAKPRGSRVRARMRLYTGPSRVRPVTVEIDLRRGGVTVPDLPRELRGAAAVKARRVWDLLRAARVERRNGSPVPQAVMHPGLSEDADEPPSSTGPCL